MADFAFEIGEVLDVKDVECKVISRNEITGRDYVTYTIAPVDQLEGNATSSDTAPAAQPEEPETLLPR